MARLQVQLRVQVRVAFQTVKDRLRELWLELLQRNFFSVIAKVLARVTRKNVELYPKPVTPVDRKVIFLVLEICHYYMYKLLLVGKV